MTCIEKFVSFRASTLFNKSIYMTVPVINDILDVDFLFFVNILELGITRKMYILYKKILMMF